MKTDLVELKKGSTWQNVYDTLWHIGTVRYVTFKQLKRVFKNETWCGKCVTPKKIKLLNDKKYIRHHENDVLCLTEKGLEFLQTYSEYNTDIIKLITGTGDKDGIFNADTLMRAIQVPDFFALFYPDSDFYQDPKDHQPFLVPDGVLVLRKDDKLKLVFLEIENEKPDWQKHVEDKCWKYETIAERETTWSEWWRNWCDKLNINHCPIEEFSFMVWCIGDFNPGHEWPGWVFKEKLLS